MSSTTASVVQNVPRATAVRVVTALVDTSTMRAAPFASTWVSRGASSGFSGAGSMRQRPQWHLRVGGEFGCRGVDLDEDVGPMPRWR